MSGAIQHREPWGSIAARVGREVVVIDHSLACGCGGHRPCNIPTRLCQTMRWRDRAHDRFEPTAPSTASTVLSKYTTRMGVCSAADERNDVNWNDVKR
jgi:hypothetical protein